MWRRILCKFESLENSTKDSWERLRRKVWRFWCSCVWKRHYRFSGLDDSLFPHVVGWSLRLLLVCSFGDELRRLVRSFCSPSKGSIRMQVWDEWAKAGRDWSIDMTWAYGYSFFSLCMGQEGWWWEVALLTLPMLSSLSSWFLRGQSNCCLLWSSINFSRNDGCMEETGIFHMAWWQKQHSRLWC